ncbi:Multiprotein-bridging factor 1 [Wickerhamiella sorbophila]|uniref:Multiprotein-bridging factor 1 n=1 Tax=Wickerhamiella sorbophila TaxID=45607 RepID=A0A2T0FFM9_9ASCO|nr:Multiprotein-bridging factor 1 [Wickerhamiella sorbophila]PRT53777.1 Multiprotein-bridging factor 1 [Wickerhamiella sorbophila]
MSRLPTSNTDWDTQTVVGSRARVGGGGPRATVARSQAEINAARRSGNVLAVEKKFAAGNKSGNPEGQRLAKIDRDDNVAPPAKISADVGKAIQKGRQDKNLTQKDLATAINEKPQVINDYEAGRAVPNQQVLGKIERKLGIKLRGKDIGSPLGGPKKK